MDVQKQFDMAVIVPTTLRPSLSRSIQYVFSQDFRGRIQILIGIDIRCGDPALIGRLCAQCPANMNITVLDLGYSTSSLHGGVYPNKFSGALRTILSYAANSNHVAYLDDDDWWHREHLSSLMSAIGNNAWAFSLRWFADAESGMPICEDTWDSLDPGTQGINAQRWGGFVSPSNLVLRKDACHFVFPSWALSPFPDGTGEDRLVFDALRKIPQWTTNTWHSCYYSISVETAQHAHHKREFDARNITWIYNRDAIKMMSALCEQAEVANANNRASEVQTLADEVLKINPNHARALLLKGAACRFLGDMKDR